MHLASAQVIHSSYLRRNVVFINVLKLFFDISSGAEQAHLFHSVSILSWGDLFYHKSSSSTQFGQGCAETYLQTFNTLTHIEKILY